ncbi:hypothetical protein EBZ39_06035 [bacterium]|nr:hypothetical protein [bacterium]
MEELVFKYGVIYGPLMIFYLAVGYIVWKWLPPVFQVVTSSFREMIAALNSSTIALQNCTKALDANNHAIERHHETFRGLEKLWDEMKILKESLPCQAELVVGQKSTVVKIRKPANNKLQKGAQHA